MSSGFDSRYERALARGLRVLVLAVFVALPASAIEPTVVVLSLDGVRHDYLDLKDLPGFDRVAREGMRARGLVPTFPSSTFTNHVSLATGATAEVHGIVANRFHDAELGDFDYGNDARFIQAEPVWAAAERQGVRAATFFWVGSETDWRDWGASYRRKPFDSEIQESEKIEQILRWLDLPAEKRPRLILSWWHGADSAGHAHGPDHENVADSMREQDAELRRLLAGIDERALWPGLTLVLVSDHGMVSVERTHDVRAALDEAGLEGRVFHGGGVANVHLERPADETRAVALLSALEGATAYPRRAFPRRLRYDHVRSGDVVVLADPGVALLPAWRGLDLLHRAGGPFGRKVGMHGYDPEASEAVHGIFLAMGRGVSAGHASGRVRTLDVAATLAGLLGIEPPAQSEGRAIPLGPDARGSQGRVSSEGPAAAPAP